MNPNGHCEDGQARCDGRLESEASALGMATNALHSQVTEGAVSWCHACRYPRFGRGLAQSTHNANAHLALAAKRPQSRCASASTASRCAGQLLHLPASASKSGARPLHLKV
eukprot:3739728-Prymnesium_polylepis.1